MGRRRKCSAAVDLMDFVAVLAWWAATGLRTTSYWLLHGVATRPLPAMQAGRQVNDAPPLMPWQEFATGGKYLIPFICLVGALASSFLHRRKRRALFDQASKAIGASALQSLSWKEFEMLVVKASSAATTACARRATARVAAWTWR